MVRNPRSSSIRMNFPWRRTDFTCWPRKRWRSVANFWRTTWCEENLASSIVRPVRRGASERTTVSTSGSSGTRFRIEQDVVALGLDGEFVELDGGVIVVLAGAAVIRPLVPGAHHQVVLHGALPDG